MRHARHKAGLFAFLIQTIAGFQLQQEGAPIVPTNRALVRRQTAPIAQIDDRGRLYVIDDQRNQINLYSPKGRLIGSIADSLFRGVAVKAFAVNEMGLAALIELYGRELVIATLVPGSARIIRRVELPAEPISVIWSGNEFLVSLADADGAVVRVRPNGVIRVAFRIAAAENIPPIQRYLHDQVLYKVPDTDLLIAASAMMPTLSAYTGRGEKRWVVNLRRFRQAEIAQIDSNQLRISTPERGYQTITGVFAISAEMVAVQLLLTTRPGKTIAKRFEIRLLRTSDGKEIQNMVDVPPLLATSRAVIYGYDFATGRYVRLRLVRSLRGAP
ncbi:MAG TPA: hypothetical protein VF042_14225 [Gemmatimonadaceae bacterium]